MNNTRGFALLALAFASTVALAGCTTAPEAAPAPAPTASTTASAGHNAADEMFAAMMVVHHEQALEMSEILLAKEGVPADVADLAKRIATAQGPEIERMNEWLTEWDAPAADDMGGMHHGMDGMVADEDIAKLTAADGPRAATLFLEQMILHHEGAVDMAGAELAAGEDPRALELSQQVIDSQTPEIEEMRALLAQK